jgi:protein-S-isoprenylcysteine O-methyltransferase Ste14
MIDTLVIVLVVTLVLGFAMGFYWGRAWVLSHATPITTQQIERYLEEKFPDEWAAYERGVMEGYNQGLRDGQEPFA